MTFVELQPEIARAVFALLEREERQALAGTCRTIASTKSRSSATLVFPPTDPDRARRLLAYVNPASYARIQIASAWHVDLLVECGRRDKVRSVRVRPEVDVSAAAVEEICSKLTAFQELTQLDLSDTNITNVAILAQLPKLQYLNLSRTDVVDASPLAVLVQLRELVLEDTQISDLSCVRHMIELRELVATRGWGEAVEWPSLRSLTKIHTLRVRNNKIVSSSDFVAALGNLRHLSVGMILEPDAKEVTSLVPLNTLIPGLGRLESIYDQNNVTAPALSALSSLRVIEHRIHADFEALASLQSLESLYFLLPSTLLDAGQTDYQFLRGFPNLKSIVVDQSRTHRDDEAANAEMASLLEVLAHMPQVEKLRFDAYVDNELVSSYIPRFKTLRHLTVRTRWDTGIELFDWITPCRSLRSLVVQADTTDVDISAIGNLIHLETLSVTNTRRWPGEPDDFPFLLQLTNLRSLELEGKIRDLAALANLSQLRFLMIRSRVGYGMRNHDVLGRLLLLQELDIAKTVIFDVRPLTALPHLRRVAIASSADCRPLTSCDHPSLLYVLHPDTNCLWTCSFGTIDEGDETA